MDIEKIYKIINIILETEKKIQIQSKLNNINSYIQNSQKTESIKILVTEIKNGLLESEINNFISSDIKIINSLGLLGFFDIELINKINNELKSPYHEQKTKFNNFVKNRADKIGKITTLFNSITGIIKFNLSDKNNYQIVLSLPGTFHNYSDFIKVNSNIKNFLSYLNQGSENKKEIKISSVNNGCLEIFIEAGIELIKAMGIVLNYISSIYGTIEASKKAKKYIINLKEKRRKKVEKEIDDNLKEEKEDIINNLVSELGIEKSLESDVKNSLLKVLKDYENGLSIQIKTPLLDKPNEIKEDDSKELKIEKKEKQKLYKEKKLIDESNKKIMEFEKQGIQLNLPESGEKVE